MDWPVPIVSDRQMKAVVNILLMPLIIAYGVIRDKVGWTHEADRARTNGATMASLVAIFVIYVVASKLLRAVDLPFPAWAMVATSVLGYLLILYSFVDRGFGDARWTEFQRASAWQRTAGYVATIVVIVGTITLLLLRW